MAKRLTRVLLMGIFVTACSNSSVKVLNEDSAKALIERALQSKSDPSTAEMQAGGKVEIGEVTNLQLVTETRAAANFAWRSSQDRGAGVVEFVKKPDGTWVLLVAKAHDVDLVARQETFAIGALRAISTGQATFAASGGNGLYSPTLANLGTPPNGG